MNSDTARMVCGRRRAAAETATIHSERSTGSEGRPKEMIVLAVFVETCIFLLYDGVDERRVRQGQPLMAPAVLGERQRSWTKVCAPQTTNE